MKKIKKKANAIIAVIFLFIILAAAVLAYLKYGPTPEDGALYCQYGDVYQDGQLVQNCLIDVEECQVVDGIAQCVPYDSGGSGGDTEPTGELYCQYGDVYQDGVEYQNCYSSVEECQVVNGVAQCVPYGATVDVQGYCYWGDVYSTDGSLIQNCYSSVEECQVVDGVAQCVPY